MKNSLFKLFIFALPFFVFTPPSVFSQQAKVNALQIQPSNLIEDLIRLKAENPKLNIEELVKTANAMLDKQGFNYAFSFSENTCRLIGEARKKQKDQTSPLNLTANLNSVGGDKTSILLPEEKYDKSECGRCFVYLPVWEATDKDFVTFIHGINVKFYLPADFQLNEVALVDNRDLTRVIRRWKLPFRAQPLSISDDGKILYLALPENQLNELALMIFDEGVVQFYARKAVEPNKKGKMLGDFPSDAANPNLSFISFEDGNIKQTVRFTAPCSK